MRLANDGTAARFFLSWMLSLMLNNNTLRFSGIMTSKNQRGANLQMTSEGKNRNEASARFFLNSCDAELRVGSRRF